MKRVIALFIIAGVLSAGAAQRDTVGAYDAMSLPTAAERAALDVTAKRHHVEFSKALHDMSDDDVKTWSQIFAVSMDFHTFDRAAQVYAYQIYTSWLYFVQSAGVEKYAKLVEAQPPAVRQRIRDILYFDAAMASQQDREIREKELRSKCPQLFPESYVFGKDDDLFKSG